MGEEYASTKAMGYGQVKAPPSEHEDAAIQWARAKEKLLGARNESQRAGMMLDEATKAEQEAWLRLENVAGRGAPASPMPIGSAMQTLRAY